MALYREQLDRMTCQTPGCNHSSHDGMFFHGRCHVQSPTWAEYKDGNLTVTCAECKSVICVIAVASLEDQRNRNLASKL